MDEIFICILKSFISKNILYFYLNTIMLFHPINSIKYQFYDFGYQIDSEVCL